MIKLQIYHFATTNAMIDSDKEHTWWVLSRVIYGDHFTIYANIESLHYILETSITCQLHLSKKIEDKKKGSVGNCDWSI